jgi:hypothetical protein
MNACRRARSRGARSARLRHTRAISSAEPPATRARGASSNPVEDGRNGEKSVRWQTDRGVKYSTISAKKQEGRRPSQSPASSSTCLTCKGDQVRFRSIWAFGAFDNLSSGAPRSPFASQDRFPQPARAPRPGARFWRRSSGRWRAADLTGCAAALRLPFRFLANCFRPLSRAAFCKSFASNLQPRLARESLVFHQKPCF